MADFIRKSLGRDQEPSATENPLAGSDNVLEPVTPVDLQVKDSSPTSFRVQFRLPSTGEQGTRQVYVFVRLHSKYYALQKELIAMQAKKQKMNLAFNQKQIRIPFKDRKHTAFNEFYQTELLPLEKEIAIIRNNFEKDCKKMLGAKPSVDGWVIPHGAARREDGELEASEYKEFNVAENFEGAYTVSTTDDFVSIVLSGLHSHCAYDVEVRTSKVAGDKLVLSGATPAKLIWTTQAPWQKALEEAGLKELIVKFDECNLRTPESWSKLVEEQAQQSDPELQLDPARIEALKRVIFECGFVSAEQQAVLDKEKKDLDIAVSAMIAAHVTKDDTIRIGDAVSAATNLPSASAGSFGVVTTISQINNKVDVKWSQGTEESTPVAVKRNDLVRSKFNVFLSHAQHEAQSQCGMLSLTLRQAGYSVWYDQDAERLEARDMVRGINNSDVFVLYLTKSYFTRYFCRMEATAAMKLGYKKEKLIVIYESDPRTGYGGPDYIALVKQATSKYPEFYNWITEVEAIPMARRAYQRHAMIEEVGKRIKRSGGKPSLKVTAISPKSKPQHKKKSSVARMMKRGAAGLHAVTEGITNNNGDRLEKQLQDVQAELFLLKTENQTLWNIVENLRLKVEELST